MKVKSLKCFQGACIAQTSGADFYFAAGQIRVAARIPKPRLMLTLDLEIATGTAFRWRIQDECEELITFSAEDQAGQRLISVALGADSLLKIQCLTDSSLSLSLERHFNPEFSKRAKGLLYEADPAGGYLIHTSKSPMAERQNCWNLAAGQDFDCHVFPPRLPNRKRLAQSIAHEGRPQAGKNLPSAAVIAQAGRSTQIMALHAYFWREENRRWRPRFSRYTLRPCPWTSAIHRAQDEDELIRVHAQAQEAGMEVLAYLSPRYSRAEDIAGEAARIVDTYGFDGLYLDGLPKGVERAHSCIRNIRNRLGKDKIIYLHMDEQFFAKQIPCPFIDCHADFVLRGSSGRGYGRLEDFLRYQVSGWNISGAVGVWCHYGSAGISGRLKIPWDRRPNGTAIKQALAAHVRIWRRSNWGSAQVLQDFDNDYYPALDQLVRREEAFLVANPSQSKSFFL